MKVSTTTYLVILGGSTLWCVAIVLPPLLFPLGGLWGAEGVALYQFFHTICHQLPERSMFILGAPIAVCIRCSAIYLGFLLGTATYHPLRSLGISLSDKRGLLVASALPMLLDVVLDEFGLHASTAATRLITGSFFGIIVPFYIIPSAQEAVQELLESFRLLTSSEVTKGSIHA